MATHAQITGSEIYDEVLGTPSTPLTGYTYDDLLAFPEDNFRREIIEGELIVTAAPGGRHQDVVLELGAALLAYTKATGGKVYVAPRDVHLSHVTVVEPDVMFVAADNLAIDEEPFLKGAPDLVVEVSSPSTRRLELVRKRDLYAGAGVLEYWYIDRSADRVEIYRLVERSYGTPLLLGRGDLLQPIAAPGFSIAANDLLGPLS